MKKHWLGNRIFLLLLACCALLLLCWAAFTHCPITPPSPFSTTSASYIVTTDGSVEDTNILLSAADAQTLRSDKYYLKYTTRWLLAQEQAVEVEEAYNGDLFLQRYEVQGEPLVSVISDKTMMAFDDSELLLEQENLLPYVSPYAELQYNGQCGAVTLDGNELYYEEYDLPQGDDMRWLRFLYLNNELWGLQIDRLDRYTRVVTLGNDIPDDLLAYA